MARGSKKKYTSKQNGKRRRLNAVIKSAAPAAKKQNVGDCNDTQNTRRYVE